MHRFRNRFHHIERRLAESGRRPSEASLAEMDDLWDEAKRQAAASRDVADGGVRGLHEREDVEGRPRVRDAHTSAAANATRLTAVQVQ